MSYCVNCGVELDATLKKCPLCETIVYHPGKMEVNTQETFPKKKGEVETVSKKESIIFVSILLFTIAVTCALLNILVYNRNWWSIPVNGVCITLWVFFMAAIFCEKITVYGMLLLDAIAIGNYLFMISLITSSDHWVIMIGLPILVVTFGLLELSVFLSKKLPSSLLTGTLYFFVTIAGVCITVEATIDNYLREVIRLGWSAIVVTVCAIISVFIILILMMGRLRNSIRRRLHF
ncbi:MAG: hypothetical protein IJA34_03920 [Lachnospiraceae bacterium]|nr:hypothetical protein [Lachnospiraceae bacterium]